MDLNKIDEEFKEEFRNLNYCECGACGVAPFTDILEWVHSKLKEAYEKGKEDAYELIGQQYEVSKRIENKLRLQTLEEVEKKIGEIVKGKKYSDELFLFIRDFLQTIKELKKSMIEIKSKFNGWREVGYEEALEYAKWKLKAITMGKSEQERLDMINLNLRGVQFTLNEII